MPQYFIGVDCGTQSTKAVVLDGDTGTILATAAKQYGLIAGLAPGHKEQHPAAWIKAVKQTIQVALKKSKVNRKLVRGIGVSGQQHGFVALDKKDQVIRPAKLWNDTSTIKQCEQITKKLGGTAGAVKQVGNAIAAGFTAPKILWLKQNEPSNFAKLATVLLPHDYLNFWLTGNKVMEAGDASGTALLDVKSRQWSSKAAQSIDSQLKDKLPRVAASYQAMGTLRPQTAKELGLEISVRVSPGGGDNMMGAIGTGNVEEGVVTASLGTSGTIYAFSKKPVVDEQGDIAGFCDSTGYWLPLLCTMNVTVATELAKKAFGYSNETLTKAMAKVPAGSKGLLLLPYFEGERTPSIPEGTGVYFGVNQTTYSPAYFSRAAMEGATLGMNYGLNRIRELGIKPKQIRLIGGGANNPLWRQVAADVFNVEVVAMQESEGASLGGALQAMWVCNPGTPLAQLCRKFAKIDPKTLCRPAPANVRVYAELQKLHDQASQQLRPVFKNHRAFITSGLSAATKGRRK